MNKLLLELVKKLGKYKVRRSVEYSFKCPRCQDYKNRLDVNFNKGVFNCYNCHWSGYIKELKKHLNLHTPPTMRAVFNSIKEQQYQVVLSLPKEVISLSKERMAIPIKLFSFLLDKNCHNEYSEWYYCESGYYSNRLIIPCYENGNLVTWCARSYIGAEPKDLAPPSSISNRSHYLYNFDGIVKDDKVIIVEGIFDCLHLKREGYKAVSIFGSHLSEIQIGKLLSKQPSQIILMFDGDDAGREGQVKAFNSLRKRYDFLKIRNINLDEGKDPDDMSKEQLCELLG